jgi:tol-pal system protein YbgF
MKSINTLITLAGLSVSSLLVNGCGTVPESTSDTWESAPPVSVTARLEYRVDSLMNENRRAQQQVEALTTENRNLTARNAELETRLNEMAAAPRAASPAVTASPVQATPSASSTSGYEGALAAFRSRDFAGAISGFENVLKGNTPDDIADNCHYWMGESYYGLRKYKDAIEQFQTVLNFKKSDKKDDAQLMLANARWAMGDKAGAREAYNTLIAAYPMSPLVAKAKEKIARLR